MTNSVFTSQLKSNAAITVAKDNVLLISTSLYNQQTRILAHGLKDGDKNAMQTAALQMVNILPENAVLIPMPSHLGYAKQTLRLVNLMSDISGAPVADVLVGRERMSNYHSKKNGHPLKIEDLGIRLNGNLPEGKVPCVIDNVIDTGVSAFAAANAIGSCVVLAYAITSVLL